MCWNELKREFICKRHDRSGILRDIKIFKSLEIIGIDKQSYFLKIEVTFYKYKNIEVIFEILYLHVKVNADFKEKSNMTSL